MYLKKFFLQNFIIINKYHNTFNKKYNNKLYKMKDF
jgi:hypothetical protein